MDIAAYSFVVALSYLLGSLPTGYLVGRARGIDIRTVGSRNIGATNVFRVLGRTAGIVVLLVDAGKGFAAALWSPVLALLLFSKADVSPVCMALAAGVAAILGHNYTCWLNFKGGKGVATTAGVALAWVPAACACAILVWVAAFLLTRYVSVASIVAAVALPIAVWLFHGGPTMTGVITCLSLLAIYKHKANIQRLMQGTENRAWTKNPAREPTR